MKLSVQQCLDNIYALAKEKNIKISDLEKEAEVSPGYFSRLSKKDKPTFPQVDVLMAVANKLDISLDILVTCDFNSVDQNVLYIVAFIERLINVTTSDTTKKWEIDQTLTDPDAIASANTVLHPLCVKTDEFQGVTEGCNYSEWFYKFEYISRFYHNEEYVFSGILYEYELMGGDKACLTKLTTKATKLNIYELYVIDEDNKIYPICCSTSTSPEVITQKLIDLFKIATESNKKIIVSEKAKDIINDFMLWTGPDAPF